MGRETTVSAESAAKVLIVTTNDYTLQARELADSLNVKLFDGNGLVELVDAQNPKRSGDGVNAGILSVKKIAVDCPPDGRTGDGPPCLAR